jgi:hypothetical protein
LMMFPRRQWTAPGARCAASRHSRACRSNMSHVTNTTGHHMLRVLFEGHATGCRKGCGCVQFTQPVWIHVGYMLDLDGRGCW